MITEKFKDIFPDPNIEAALIAMDNFVAMQTKAKQLVQIYKPAHDSPMASAAILVHTVGTSPTKSKSFQPKSSQHQLAPINQSPDNPNTGEYNGNNADEDADMTEIPMAVELEETLITGMIIKIEELVTVKDNWNSSIIEGMDKITHLEVDEDNGMEMILITVTETIGIEILKVKVILTGVEDGILIIEVKDIVIVEEGEDEIPINNIMIQGINNPTFQIQIIIVHHLWDINIDTQSHMNNTHTPNNNNNTNPKFRQLHRNKRQIFVNCVIVKAITIINANLQVISWPTYKKPSIKADHTTIRTLIMGTGHMATMITMTLMDNLFSSGGSRCR